MAHPVHAPRVNNNDDVVKVVRVSVAVGDAVSAGDLLMEVETEKAVVDVEAEADGYVLAVMCEPGQNIAVGAVVVWLGDEASEAVPASASQSTATTTPTGDMTAKARLLLRRHGLAADSIPRAGDRLSAADIETYLAAHPEHAAQSAEAPARKAAIALPAPADIIPLSPFARGMLATVTWQRDHAATAYLEIEYDPRPWEAAAAEFMRARRLMFSPLLSLMAHRLSQLAPDMGANATIQEHGEPSLVRYRNANLGFTVQAGEVLYLCVIEAAETLSAEQFVNKLFDLQRRAMGHKLAPSEMRGATIGFTSMARWGVQRHQPVLAPNTGVMVAHAASAPGGERAVLGITYDHRLLSGFAAVQLLKKLTQPASYVA
jgi:pyruvate/2-oxoglutarate dehydrogenase complex dihydrolipoamide acyltransferase (E2) component